MSLGKITFVAGNYSLISRNKWLIVLLIWLPSVTLAQDQTNFTQFFLNPYLHNASYVGIDGQSALSLIYKKQWMTVDGSPTIANFSLQSPVSPRVSLGLNITNDTRGILNNSAMLLTFGYNFALAEHAFLRFGISGGGTWNTLDTEKLESLNNDPALGNILESNASITGNAGISVHIKTFQLGASMPTLFSPSYISQEDFTITEIKPFQSLIINASNRFYFGDDKNIFEPYALYRINAELPPQFEVAGILHLNHVVWFGGSYKQDFGISGLAGVKLKNTFAIGGSYSLQNSGVNELNSPSFEISLNILLGKHKKDVPLYSFVNTVKEKEKKPVRKSASELIAEKRKADEAARKLKAEELAKQKKAEEEAKKKADELAREEAARAKREAEELAKNTPPPRVEEVIPVVEDQPIVQPVAPPPVDKGRHEYVKRGGHLNELAAADYIIAGAFSSEANAKKYAAGLVNLGYLGNYGHLTEKNLWYVYIHQSNDINQARVERDKYRKLRMFKDAWLLTVQH